MVWCGGGCVENGGAEGGGVRPLSSCTRRHFLNFFAETNHFVLICPVFF